MAITLDVMMPDMDGWGVLAALKADPALRDIPVIMLTMVDDPRTRLHARRADYATKPVNRPRLSQNSQDDTPAPPAVPGAAGRGRCRRARV